MPGSCLKKRVAKVGCLVQSFAIKRRSRCGSVRGRPVLSSHFSPGAAPQVGQWTASICFRLSSFFMSEIMPQNRCTGMVNFEHYLITYVIFPVRHQSVILPLVVVFQGELPQ